VLPANFVDRLLFCSAVATCGPKRGDIDYIGDWIREEVSLRSFPRCMDHSKVCPLLVPDTAELNSKLFTGWAEEVIDWILQKC
jgi:hypothetical protein